MTTVKNQQSTLGITGSAQPDDIHSCSEEKTGAAVEPSRPASQLQIGQFQNYRIINTLLKKSKPGMFWCYTHCKTCQLKNKASTKGTANGVMKFWPTKRMTYGPQDTSEGSGGYHRAQLAVVKRQRKYQSVMTLA